MRQAYATAAAYVDDGMAMTTITTDGGSQQSKTLMFTTAFVRAGAFRWEMQAPSGADEAGEWGRYIVWSSGSGASTWWSQRDTGVSSFPDIDRALDGPRGISGGAAVDIPGLLMPDLQHAAGGLRTLTEPRVVGHEVLDQANCWIIEAKGPAGKLVRLWVEGTTSMVRRVVHEQQLPRSRTRMIREYKPVLGDLALATRRAARGIDVGERKPG
jgi:hypothetical protein